MAAKVMPAGEFKAKCLAVMDEVQDKRTTITITKNGKPVAQMVPFVEEVDPIFGFFSSKARIVGDLATPLYSDKEYEEFFDEEAAKYSVGLGNGKQG